MFRSFVSLYYSSIGFTQMFYYLYLLLVDLVCLRRGSYLLSRLRNIVRDFFPNSICYSFSTGRGAIAAALKMAGIGKGDEVIISAFTCLAVPTAVLETGACPVYVDINSGTLNTEISSIVSAITPKTKAVILQHTLGNPSDVNELINQIRNSGIIIIEDCALSIGSQIDGKYVGSFAHAAIFSFELSKTLSTGWGGMLLINDSSKFNDHAVWYENCRTKYVIDTAKDIFQTFVSSVCHKSGFYFVGKYLIYIFFKCKVFRYSTTADESSLIFNNAFSLRMSKAMNRLSFIQWKRLNEVAKKCSNNYIEVREQAILCGYTIPDTPGIADKQRHVVSARISFLVRNRENFISFFTAKGFEVGLWFDGPLSPEPGHGSFAYNKEQFPQACYIAKHIVNLPCHSRMKRKEIINLKASVAEFARLYPQEFNTYD